MNSPKKKRNRTFCRVAKTSEEVAKWRRLRRKKLNTLEKGGFSATMWAIGKVAENLFPKSRKAININLEIVIRKKVKVGKSSTLAKSTWVRVRG